MGYGGGGYGLGGYGLAGGSGSTGTFIESQFPVDISWGARGGGEFLTWVLRSKAGVEQRNVSREEPQMKYTVSQNVLTDAKKQFLIAFAKGRYGMFFGFRFQDFFDYQAVNEPFVTALNPIGWASPAGPYQMSRTYGDSARTCYRRIFKPCSGLVTDVIGHTPPVPIIYNGATALVAGTDYTLDVTTGLVTMLGSTVPTSWSGEFDVPVRFDEDSARFLLMASGNTDWPDIKITGQRMENVILARSGAPVRGGPSRPPLPQF
jgi:uncharacterized protein (TIGR02217 family)